MLRRILFVSLTILYCSCIFAYNDEINFDKDYPIKTRLTPIGLNDNSFNSKFESALKNISWMDNADLLAINIIDKNWTIQRDEFTGILRYRYIKAEVIIKVKGKNNIFVVPVTFIQKAKFFGLYFTDIYYRFCHKYEIYQIKESDFNKD